MVRETMTNNGTENIQ